MVRSPDQDRRVRHSALVLAAVAMLVYFGYIAMKLYRHYR